MDESVPPPEYADDDVLLRIESPTASRPTLRLAATGAAIRAVVELTVPAAAWLATMLQNVSVDAVNGADYPEGDDK